MYVYYGTLIVYKCAYRALCYRDSVLIRSRILPGIMQPCILSRCLKITEELICIKFTEPEDTFRIVIEKRIL